MIVPVHWFSCRAVPRFDVRRAVVPSQWSTVTARLSETRPPGQSPCNTEGNPGVSAPLPDGYSIRAPILADATEVAALVNTTAHDEVGGSTTAVEDILSQWEDPERTIEDEDWLVIAPNGQIVGYLELYEYPPYTVFEFDGYVHPEHRGKGIGSALLGTIERRARREMHPVAIGERVTLQTRVWNTAFPAHDLLGAHGYTHIRDWRQMEISFEADLPAATWPEGFAVRTMVRGQDEQVLFATIEEAFADHWGHSPMPFVEFLYYSIEGAPGFDADLTYFVTVGDDVAGAAICSASRSGEPEIGWVSRLGVRRGYRGKGVGLSLLQHIFNEMHSRGKRGVGLNVDGSSLTGTDRLYERARMHEIRRALYFEKEIRSR